MSDKKIRILALCDSPTTATGFAQVSRNILNGLAKTGKYRIDVVGINYFGDFYDRDKFQCNIYPAMPQGEVDVYGRTRFLAALNGDLVQNGLVPPWDIVFTIQDPFVLEGLGLPYPWAEQLRVSLELWRKVVPPEAWFDWIAYWPVDSDLKENWVTRSIALSGVPVAYCDWGADQIKGFDREKFELMFNYKQTKESEGKMALIPVPSLKDRVSVIPHGVDLDVFKPISDKEKKEFRKKYFNGELSDDTFLIVNVSRNQPRKDLTRTLKCFAEFKKIVPKSHLYLHCKVSDAGGSIDEMARNFGLIPAQDYTVPYNFSANQGFSVEVVNKIYNAADLCMTTTLGEGWGFITTEAMAAKTPIIAPNITSIMDIFNSRDGTPETEDLDDPEIRSKLRGIPVKAGSTSSEWICMGLEDNERIRPLTNVDDMVEKMVWVYRNPGKVNQIVENAYNWIQDLDWKKIVIAWDELFMETYNKLDKKRKTALDITKAARNDPCPCGSGKKFKKCHFAENSAIKVQDWIDAAKEKEKKEDGKKGVKE